MSPNQPVQEQSPSPLLEVVNVKKSFPIRKGAFGRVSGHLHAVNGVTLRIMPGTTTGLVGETGSGKSTLGRLILRLTPTTSGEILFEGSDILGPSSRQSRHLTRDIQVVFQDPYSSFHPQSTILNSLLEPLKTHRRDLSEAQRVATAAQTLKDVGLSPDYLHHFPEELSGGQLQRAAIARALMLEPRLVILDEPISSLDVSTQAQVINLLKQLQQKYGVAYLFIAHDLSVVRHVSDRIAVMYLGRIVEEGPAEVVYTSPRHPYTRLLLSSVPVPNPIIQRSRAWTLIKGDIPSPSRLPSGCYFHARCPDAMPICRSQDPTETVQPEGSRVYCHLYGPLSELSSAEVSVAKATSETEAE